MERLRRKFVTARKLVPAPIIQKAALRLPNTYPGALAKELEKMQGGQVAVSHGKVRAELPLPIAGLVSDRPLKEVIGRIAALNAAARSMGCRLDAPFMTLSFLSLSPIPALKLTDQGLIDALNMRATSLFV